MITIISRKFLWSKLLLLLISSIFMLNIQIGLMFLLMDRNYNLLIPIQGWNFCKTKLSSVVRLINLLCRFWMIRECIKILKTRFHRQIPMIPPNSSRIFKKLKLVFLSLMASCYIEEIVWSEDLKLSLERMRIIW